MPLLKIFRPGFKLHVWLTRAKYIVSSSLAESQADFHGIDSTVKYIINILHIDVNRRGGTRVFEYQTENEMTGDISLNSSQMYEDVFNLLKNGNKSVSLLKRVLSKNKRTPYEESYEESWEGDSSEFEFGDDSFSTLIGVPELDEEIFSHLDERSLRTIGASSRSLRNKTFKLRNLHYKNNVIKEFGQNVATAKPEHITYEEQYADLKHVKSRMHRYTSSHNLSRTKFANRTDVLLYIQSQAIRPSAKLYPTFGNL